MKILRNIIGPQVRRLRCQMNWSQNDLAQKLQSNGWEVCRQTIARIEAREQWVGDFHMYYLAEVFNVMPSELYPKFESKQPLHECLNRLFGRYDGQF